jgi:hypothetical protein
MAPSIKLEELQEPAIEAEESGVRYENMGEGEPQIQTVRGA